MHAGSFRCDGSICSTIRQSLDFFFFLGCAVSWKTNSVIRWSLDYFSLLVVLYPGRQMSVHLRAPNREGRKFFQMWFLNFTCLEYSVDIYAFFVKRYLKFYTLKCLQSTFHVCRRVVRTQPLPFPDTRMEVVLNPTSAIY